MREILCDLCGKPIKTFNAKYKIKKAWSDPYGHGWETLDAHQECIKILVQEVSRRKGREKKRDSL